MTPTFLIDTSALVRLHRGPALRDVWRDKVDAGLVGICPITELELLFSARSMADRVKIVRLLTGSYIATFMPDGVYQRAAEVQDLLTRRGQHRSAGPIDLLVAAAAELNGLTVLHYDGDFDVIRRATGQPAQWLAPPGTIR
ncbi:PIN domain nuclease [Catellatospora sichuanensis]|uniref:PIN domain nuclease n=1 Tax=Catellatospora sichuanensis TaxID=1969805 RepID=UPI0011831966|nr:PIN domain nuclease [Catellatospora sichuanensis]